MFICHHCDNPSCVNPEHLFIGTRSENMKDAYKEGRVHMPTNGHVFQNGHIPSNRKLSTDRAKEIKEIIRNRCKKSLYVLSNELNVSIGILKRISCGVSYRNV